MILSSSHQFVFHVVTFEARAMFALKTHTVEKPYGI